VKDQPAVPSVAETGFHARFGEIVTSRYSISISRPFLFSRLSTSRITKSLSLLAKHYCR
jgi:hypothetical protein